MIETPDLIICIGYIVVIVCIGLWTGLRKKSAGNTSVSEEYFLAGKTLRWPMIGLALFATNISCIHLVSLAQSGFDTGLLNGNFEWMASLTLILLALFFVPFYIRSGVPTLPVFLQKRYNQACRDWLTIISIVSAVIIHIAFSLLAGGIVLETLFGINMYVSVTVIAVLVAIYTMIGGLKAVVVTESIQTIVLVGGAVVITWISFSKLGDWNVLVDTLRQNNAMDKLSMLRPHGDSSGMPWYAVLLGYPVLGIWYWCADQTIVQRVLGARNENHARAGALFCGYIKILPVFIFVVPGLLAYALVQRGVLDVSSITSIDANGEMVVNSKGIYTLMISQLLPTGLVGIVVAALLSGLMSQVAGALNSISTLVSYDLYKRFRPNAADRHLVFLGRISVLAALVFSIALLPLLNSYESLFNGFNDVIAHIAPPITCVFLLGVFWRKASARAAQYTLWVGSALGVLVFALNKVLPGSWFGQTPFMMMAFYLLCACILMQVILSYIFPVVHTAESEKLYWKNPLDPLRAGGWKGIANYKFQAALLLCIMVVLYIFFG
ncbi:MAG: sodium:solute symporter [Sphingobacteriales bacterium]|nr:sodium:solute symporter [Sphingobacteriales bacterium]OJY91825.1 MAG: sodium:solute symporter [Sphingobacteriales bacterium 44-15]